MITELIHILNEMDLLEAHLEEHKGLFERTIIFESQTTLFGKKKPLNFLDNKKRFERFDVEFVEIPYSIFEPKTNHPDTDPYRQFRDLDWRRKFWVEDNVKITSKWSYHSDCDEIIDASKFDGWRDMFNEDLEMVSFKMSNRLLWINHQTGPWSGHRFTRTGLNPGNAKGLRRRETAPELGRVGWHFCNCYLDLDELRLKQSTRFWYWPNGQERSIPEMEQLREERKDPITAQQYHQDDGKVGPVEDCTKWMFQNIHLFPVLTSLPKLTTEQIEAMRRK